MKNKQPNVVDQKKGGLVPLDRHQKLAEKANKDKQKGGGRGGAPSHWN